MTELGTLRVDLSTAKHIRDDPGKHHLNVGTIDLPDGAKVTVDGVPIKGLRHLVVVVPGHFARWERFDG